jgi:hypothetical protein
VWKQLSLCSPTVCFNGIDYSDVLLHLLRWLLICISSSQQNSELLSELITRHVLRRFSWNVHILYHRPRWTSTRERNSKVNNAPTTWTDELVDFPWRCPLSEYPLNSSLSLLAPSSPSRRQLAYQVDDNWTIQFRCPVDYYDSPTRAYVRTHCYAYDPSFIFGAYFIFNVQLITNITCQHGSSKPWCMDDFIYL